MEIIKPIGQEHTRSNNGLNRPLRAVLAFALAGALLSPAATPKAVSADGPVLTPWVYLVGGTVYFDGERAPEGSIIDASCTEGVVAGRSVTQELVGGNFRIVINGEFEGDELSKGQCKPGDVITFTSGDRKLVSQEGEITFDSGTLIPNSRITDLYG